MTDKIDIKPCEDLTAKEEYKFKVVIVGDSGVGKTNLVRRFATNTFYKDSKATVGVEFLSKNYIVNDRIFKIELWDTAGQERYKSITSAYFKGAKGAMVVYDVTSKITFDNVDKWCSELQTNGSKTINIIMVGNKTDLKENIVVTTDMSKVKATNLHVPVMETSALDASNVNEAFYLLIKKMYLSFINKDKINKDLAADENIDKGVSLDTQNNQKSEIIKGCC